MSLTDNQQGLVWQHVNVFEPQTVSLDRNGTLNKETLLFQLKENFQFPDYFGDNWDAAYDLMLDYVMQLEADDIWYFSIDSATEVNQQDLEIWTQLMTDVCRYAESKGRRLRIIIQQN